MRKFLSFLMIFVLIAGLSNAQTKVAFVMDDNTSNASNETSVISTALTNGGYVVGEFDLATLDTLLYSDISSYDIVLWSIADDRVALNLWDTVTSPGVIQFYPALKEFYNNADGAIWIDGLDFFNTLAVQTDGTTENDYESITKPINYSSGDFVYDVLGVSSWNYESKTDEGSGMPQLDKSSSNSITSLNPILSKYSTLWRADGWTSVAGATVLYEMGDGAYAGAGNGSGLVQDNLDLLVADIINDVTVSSINKVSKLPIKIYPNPVTETATIILSKNKDNSNILICDISGKLVYSQKVRAGENAIINTSNFSTGLYTVTILSNNTISSTKISVVK